MWFESHIWRKRTVFLSWSSSFGWRRHWGMLIRRERELVKQRKGEIVSSKKEEGRGRSSEKECKKRERILVYFIHSFFSSRYRQVTLRLVIRSLWIRMETLSDLYSMVTEDGLREWEKFVLICVFQDLYSAVRANTPWEKGFVPMSKSCLNKQLWTL